MCLGELKIWWLAWSLCKKKIKQWNATHVYNEANGDADKLAKDGIGISLYNLWTQQ